VALVVIDVTEQKKENTLLGDDEPSLKLTLYGPVVTLYTTRFNIHKSYVLPTQRIYVFCVDLRTNSDYCTIQR